MTERDELLSKAKDLMLSVSSEVRALFIKMKPILGGELGAIGLHIGSMARIRCGLDDVSYLVLMPSTKLTLAVCDTKAEALEQARMVVRNVGAIRLAQWNADLDAELRAEAARVSQASCVDLSPSDRRQKVRSISRRRREIFEKAGGSCHYCKSVLTLDGKWHIEHKLPRALGGDNHPDNLTAACVPCNTKKRDMTDVEFKELLAASKGEAA